MYAKPPSRTARETAIHRALHQTLDDGAIFKDSFAAMMLDEQGIDAAAVKTADPMARFMRLYLAARCRFAEGALATAVARGTRQVVVLGAGLDTFALRNPFVDVGLRVFEVDRPETQAWKRERLAQARLAIPPSLCFVAVDFERGDLASLLSAAGFQSTRPAFFIWMGVVSYLTRGAIIGTLQFIAGIPDGEVVFDYGEPIGNYPPNERAEFEALAALVAESGEPWISLLQPEAIANDLSDLGFIEIDDLTTRDLADRFYGAAASDVRPGPGAHMIRARRF